jgi:hypothetical protein
MSGFLRSILRRVYNRLLRDRLPRTLGVYNGVVTRKYPLFDLTREDHEPDYKQTLVSTACSVIEEGDEVVEIGSGYGVCTVWLAKKVGDAGDVISYEAGDQQVMVAREALLLNGEVVDEDLSSRATIKHALVATSNAIYGPGDQAARMDVRDLPDCDVLLTDCEGAEIDIIEEIQIRPRIFVIETHPDFGAKTSEIQSKLTEYGYKCRTEYVTDTDSGSKHILVGRNDDVR